MVFKPPPKARQPIRPSGNCLEQWERPGQACPGVPRLLGGLWGLRRSRLSGEQQPQLGFGRLLGVCSCVRGVWVGGGSSGRTRPPPALKRSPVPDPPPLELAGTARLRAAPSPAPAASTPHSCPWLTWASSRMQSPSPRRRKTRRRRKRAWSGVTRKVGSRGCCRGFSAPRGSALSAPKLPHCGSHLLHPGSPARSRPETQLLSSLGKSNQMRFRKRVPDCKLSQCSWWL